MNLLRSVKLFTLAILSALILYPVILSIYAPLFLYRQVIKFFVKKWDPKFSRIMSGLDALLVGENPYSDPVLVVVPYFPFKTTIDRDQVVKVLDEQLIKPGVFPELTQRIVRKWGFNFWYQADNVYAEDHVKYLFPNCPDKPVTRSELRMLAFKQHWKRPFDPSRSPWEVILIPNFIDDEDPSIKSVAMLRVNHCLMDGSSVLNFMRKAAVNPWKDQKLSGQVKQPVKKKLCNIFLLITMGPYYALKMIFFSNDKSALMKNEVFLHKSGLEQWQRKPVKAVHVSLERLKNIARFHNVTMTSLLITIAMETTMRVIRREIGENLASEKGMYLAMPFPYPGHSGELTNHYTGVRLPIKVCHDDPIKTLKETSREFERIRSSIVPTVNFAISKLGGMLPACLMPKSEAVVHQTITFSNCVGPAEKVDIFGYEYDQIGFTASGNDVGTGFVFIPLSYNGKLRIDSVGTGMLLKSKKDVEEFRNTICTVLNTLDDNTNSDRDDNFG